jgi:hypothetical protein
MPDTVEPVSRPKRQPIPVNRFTFGHTTKRTKTQRQTQTQKKSPHHIADLKYFRKLTEKDMEDQSIQDIYQIKKIKNKNDVDMINLDNYMVFNRELAEGRLFPTPNKKQVLPITVFDKNWWRYTKRNNNTILKPIKKNGGKTKKYRCRRS